MNTHTAHPLTTKDQKILRNLLLEGNHQGYYQLLIDKGHHYGQLGKESASSHGFWGLLTRNSIDIGLNEHGIDWSDEEREAFHDLLQNTLMLEDYMARFDIEDVADIHSPKTGHDIPLQTVLDYHADAFGKLDLPPHLSPLPLLADTVLDPDVMALLSAARDRSGSDGGSSGDPLLDLLIDGAGALKHDTGNLPLSRNQLEALDTLLSPDLFGRTLLQLARTADTPEDRRSASTQLVNYTLVGLPGYSVGRGFSRSEEEAGDSLKTRAHWLWEAANTYRTQDQNSPERDHADPEQKTDNPEWNHADPEQDLDTPEWNRDDPEQKTDAPAPLPTWRQKLSRRLRHDPTLEPFPDITSLAEAYRAKANTLDREQLDLPRSDAERDALVNRLGRPDTPSGYELPDVSHAEDLAPTPEDLDAFRKTAHELGLTQAQMSGLYDWHAKTQSDALNAMKTEQEIARHSEENALRGEWQGRFDQQAETARRTMHALCNDETRTWLTESGLERDPRLMRLFSKVAQRLETARRPQQRDAAPLDSDQKSLVTTSLKQQIAEIMAKPGYQDASAPDHAVLVNKAYRLRQQMNRSGSRA
ncbi:MAG: hypothetical protein HQL50_14435 [Magnetococcales bacterium]|nr:hypothetical protein [Magnetococcales bacterium]